jgi:hypothetical protein
MKLCLDTTKYSWFSKTYIVYAIDEFSVILVELLYLLGPVGTTVGKCPVSKWWYNPRVNTKEYVNLEHQAADETT